MKVGRKKGDSDISSKRNLNRTGMVNHLGVNASAGVRNYVHTLLRKMYNASTSAREERMNEKNISPIGNRKVVVIASKTPIIIVSSYNCIEIIEMVQYKFHAKNSEEKISFSRSNFSVLCFVLQHIILVQSFVQFFSIQIYITDFFPLEMKRKTKSEKVEQVK